MKLALLQMDVAWEARPQNFRKVKRFARLAKEEGAELLILPEMFSTGFSMNLNVTVEEPGGETVSFLKQLATELELSVIGGVVLKGAGGLGRNSALVIDSHGRDVGTYTKCHLFSFMEEQRYHEPGSGPVVFDLNGIPVSIFICYDLRFPEIFRAVAERVHLMVVIASWPSARQLHWDLLLPARAVENQCYLAGVNRVGEGGGLTFTGGSAVYDPLGNRIAYGGEQETIIFAQINPAIVEKIRKDMPFLKDKRF